MNEKRKKITFRKALELLGAGGISLHENGRPELGEDVWTSGFVTGDGTNRVGRPVFQRGRTYYVSFNPNGKRYGLPCVAYKEVRNRRARIEQRGLSWDADGILSDAGYEIEG